jgi:hypothetical protein
MRGSRRAAAFATTALAAVWSACTAFQAAPQPDGDGGTQSSSADASSSDAVLSPAADAGVNPYVAAVLADAPLVYYRLEEMTGAGFAMSSVSSTPAAKIDGPPNMEVPGRVGLAFDFTSGNAPDLNLTASGFDFTGNAPYTVEAWLNAKSSDTNYRHVFTKDSTATPRQEWGLWLHQGAIAFERYVDNVGYRAGDTPKGMITMNAWHHVVGVYDGTQLLLYIDGTLSDGTSDMRAAKPKTATVVMGARDLGDDLTSFPGTLDELAIYGTALSQARVTAHFNAGSL